MATIPIVNTVDKRKGMITSIIAMVLLLVLLLLIKFEIATPPPKDVVVVAQAEFPPELDLKNLKVESGGSQGAASDNPLDEPKPQTEKVITTDKNPDSKEVTGESNHTNTASSNNTASTTQQSNNPFGGGSSNTGTGTGENGDVLGSNSGNNPDGGPQAGNVKRVLVKRPNVSNLKQNVDVIITLKVTIDNQGNVVYAENIKAKTTTTSQVLINKIKDVVKKQAKYNAAPGAPLTSVTLRIKIDAY